MSAPALLVTTTPNFNLNLPDIGGDWDQWGDQTNANWTWLDGALLPIWGGKMTGLLELSGDPATALGAATRQYVDAVAANQNNYLPLTGGTLTGPLQVPTGSSAATAVQLGAANNGIYAPATGNVGIAAAGTAVFGTSSITARFFIPLTMSAALTLAGDPTTALGAATRQYVDAVSAQLPNYLARSGGQMTGPLITTAGTGGSSLGIGIGNNTTGLWSNAGNALVLQTGGATNLYLSPTGNQMGQSLTMTGSATLTLAVDATQPMQAVTLQQMQGVVGGPYLPISGGTLTGALTLAGDPTVALGAVTKQYSDTKLPLAGGTLTGPLGIGLAVPGNANASSLIVNAPVSSANVAANLYSDGTNWRVLNNASVASSLIQFNGGGAAFYTAPAAAIGAVVTPTVIASISAAGRISAVAGISPGNDLTYRLALGTGSDRFMFYTDVWYDQFAMATANHYWVGSGIVLLALDSAGTLTIHSASAYKPGGGSWADSSDSRIKNVLGNYDAGLAEILALRPIRYTHKGNWQRIHPNVDPNADDVVEDASLHRETAAAGAEFIGLVAQDAEQIMPELVTQQPAMIDGARVEDLRTLDAGPLPFALVNAVQQLAARVEALEART